MKKFPSYIVLFFLFSFGLLSSVNPVEFPSHFPPTVYDLSNNKLNEKSIELGRLLFYDPILSSDNTISCASCHSPYNAFAHSDHKVSHGIGDSVGTRNAPGLFNLAWHSDFQWDGSVNHLDVQPLAPIEDSREMGENFKNVIEKLSESSFYKKKFKSAFGNNLEFENNGLEPDSVYKDWGKYKITNMPEDSLKFKVPSLRNLAYTKPYMHDGRFNSIRQVLNHYESGIQTSTTLNALLDGGILLSDDEKTDLTAFLKTLNDKEFVFNPSNQFPQELKNQLLK